MSKAILELPKMPESCSKCLLQAISAEKQIKYCTAIRCSINNYETKRRENCPLKWAEIELGKRHIKILQKRNNTWQKRYSTLDAGYNKLFKDFCKLQQKIAQLQAQVTQMREALTVANNYMPDVGHFCTCGQCKKCGTNINYASYGYCLKCARNIIDAALSDTPADYHNPADVAALIMAMEAIKAAWSDGSVNSALDKASEALAEIDKAIGGKEDAASMGD